MLQFVTIEKSVGETPLVAAEKWRAQHPEYNAAPLAYAGRLDPMASGKLLVLIGDECKRQTEYHDLDKEYEFSILFGISSDSGDVLGRLTIGSEMALESISTAALEEVASTLTGTLTLPYPRFSSKTVQGKPLHTWTLEGRLDEIEIPTITSTVYELEFCSITEISKSDMVATALKKIDTIPPVTDPNKALGNDFRRPAIRPDWQAISDNASLPDTYQIATFRCIASSGTYMRSLASLIAERCSTTGLAWHIARTKIGRYEQNSSKWLKEY